MRLVNTKIIAILLGTYNGSDYIIEQIESLLCQTNQDWTLYIRDDNSTDDTLSIIRQYCLRYSNIILLDDTIGNLKCKNNFFELLKSIESKYYMFCDHDDVWLPNKIEITYEKMKSIEHTNSNNPIIVYTDLKVVDSSLNEIHSSFWEYSKINPVILNSFNYLSVYHLVTGCTMLFNSLVKEIVFPIPVEATMHDSYISLKTINEGGILVPVSQATILYRQHSRNVVGAQDYHRNYLSSKLKNLKRVFQDNYANYKMVNQIRKTSIFTYVYYKISYLLKR